MPRDGEKTRERIVRAASSLFYRSGIRAVSVDAIAENAGVTKKSLYYHFRSKDELVEAYLISHDQPNLAQFRLWYEEAEGDVADRIHAIFMAVAAVSDKRRWRGCGFLRTAAELIETPGHPAVKAASRHKRNVEVWLGERLHDHGFSEAKNLARQVALLLDGAFSTMLVHHDPAYILSAGEAARTLVRQAARQRSPT